MSILGTVSPAAAAKTLIDYFLPMPIHDRLRSDVWGAPAVGPRDVQNGLEDATMKQWNYWDGKIIKGPDGKYHMFASRWDQSRGHGGWGRSVAVQAVSDTPIGPYVDKGPCYPDNQGGKGHNVTADVLPDGRYAILVSDTRPGDVFLSKSLDGPWEYQSAIKVDANGFSAARTTANLSLVVRPDGNFLIAPRSGAMLLSTGGITGPYKVQGPSVYPNVPGAPKGQFEDPVIWYSGGQYHMVVNCFGARKAYHLTSPDGIKNWTNRGLAYDPTTNFIRYSDGTVNHWNKIERPGVFLQNGHVTHFTFAVIDVEKNLDRGNDNHGSKVIVVPFDGEAFDKDMQNPAAPAQGGKAQTGSVPAQPR
jgi:hypothetical protein